MQLSTQLSIENLKRKLNNYITYILWGDNDDYYQGLIENIKLSKLFYKDWKILLLVANDFKKPIPKENNLEIIKFKPIFFKNQHSWLNILYRLLPISMPIDYLIFRDLDSRLSLKEFYAVEEWVNSGKTLHIMYDFIDHYRFPIACGMFGLKGGCIPNIKEIICNWHDERKLLNFNYKKYAVDEIFAKEVIYPIFQDDYFCHGLGQNAIGLKENPFPYQENIRIGQAYKKNNTLAHYNKVINFGFRKNNVQSK